MSSATYLVTGKNETISWTYDRLLSNASIEKDDLSLIGFITGLICMISITCCFILRVLMNLYNKISTSDESLIRSPSISSVTTTTNNEMSEF